MAATKTNTPAAPAIEPSTAAMLDTSAAANVAPATDFSPSGAPYQVTDIPVDHPAIDNDPRAGTTVNQNKIDLNDPRKTGSDAVAEALGMKTEAEATKAAADDKAKA